MKKFDGYVLCTDIDGTLLDEFHRIPEINKEAIAYFRENGGKFTFASGRTKPSVERITREIQPDFPVIVSNGCAICDFKNGGKYLWSVPVKENAVELAKRIIKEHPDCGPCIINETGTYFFSPNDVAREYAEIEKLELLTGNFETVEKPWFKLMFCQNEDLTSVLWEQYGNSEYSRELKLVRSGKEYFEFFDISANKGTALKKLSQICGFSLDKTIAIGDNGNDTEMITAVKYGAATGNGEECAKKNATIITVDNNHGAVADLIYKLDDVL